MDTAVPTVLVVEDNDEVRARICAAIDCEPKSALVADVSSFHAARSVFGRFIPRLALIDLELPDGSDADLICWLSTQQEPVDSLVLTVFGDERHVVLVIEAGAAGYLLKGEDSLQIGPALQLGLITPDVQ